MKTFTTKLYFLYFLYLYEYVWNHMYLDYQYAKQSIYNIS